MGPTRPTCTRSTPSRRRRRSSGAAASRCRSRATRSGSSPPSCVRSGQRGTATPPPKSSVSARRSSGASACSRTRSSSRTPSPRWSRPSRRSSPATGVSSMPSPGSNAAWLDSQTPWPKKFGLGRMRTVLAALGDPQLAYPAIHVVGTNGKSTATLTIEALLRAEGLAVGSTISPHIRGWAERIRVDGAPADFEAAVARVRAEAEAQEATQFETVCAAAFAEFAARQIDVAVVEAGLGGRLDATNVLRSHVVLLTNVGLEHTDVLGETREEIAAEKLAVVQEGTIAVLPDEEFASLAGPNVVLGGAREAAEAFLGRRLEHEVEVSLPGRLERRGEEVWDGAHNAAGAAWLVRQLAPANYVLCVSVLRDKDAT